MSWRRWDDDYVVYDVAAGQTHQLDALTACALLLLGELPIDLDALAQSVAAELSCPPQDVAGLLPAVLAQLSAAQLVETLPP